MYVNILKNPLNTDENSIDSSMYRPLQYIHNIILNLMQRKILF